MAMDLASTKREDSAGMKSILPTDALGFCPATNEVKVNSPRPQSNMFFFTLKPFQK
jgi:hypothetical protein